MRLIDGDALQKEFEDLTAIQWNKDTCTTCARAFKESAERVEDAKTIDAVQIIRCKDCKHTCARSRDMVHCVLFNLWMKEDFYCADGRRKDAID